MWLRVYVAQIVKIETTTFTLNLGPAYPDNFVIQRTKIQNTSLYSQGDQDFYMMIDKTVCDKLGIKGE